jgi:hypothetical protein
VLEHIAVPQFAAVCDNLLKHLARGGLCVLCISHISDVIRGVELHQTIKPSEWWIELFDSCGLQAHDELQSFFNTQFVRGRKQDAPHSFHLVLARHVDLVPAAAPLSAKERLLDA